MNDKKTEKPKKNRAASILGRLGGKSKLEKYGVEHYREMANKRWDQERKRKKEESTGK